MGRFERALWPYVDASPEESPKVDLSLRAIATRMQIYSGLDPLKAFRSKIYLAPQASQRDFVPFRTLPAGHKSIEVCPAAHIGG